MSALFSLSKNTFKETIRDKILYLLVFFALLLIGFSWFAADLAGEAAERVTANFALATFHFFGLVITIFVGTNLIYREITEKTIFLLFSKPISRWDFIFSKFLGLASVLSLTTLLMSIVVLIITGFNILVLSIILLLLLSFLLLLSLVLFFSSFMRPLLAAFASFLTWVIGNLTDDLRIFTENNPVSSLSETLAQILYFIWPNFSALNLKNELTTSTLPEPSSILLIMTMATLTIVLFLFLAKLIFSRREF
jgi:ABC-type transport system involved in multi-copper enzyme maturation permease subunit